MLRFSRIIKYRTYSVRSRRVRMDDLPLAQVDPEMAGLIQQEKQRQRRGLEMIASENLTSRAVMEALGSCLTNKYSEGLPGRRYYGGNQVIDQVERLCQRRALEAYRLDPLRWGVNVQPLSGSPANFAVFTGLLQPGDRIMGLDLPSGGHLSHGFVSGGKPISAPAKYFQSLGYRINRETGLIDFQELEELSSRFYPQMLICGGSAYPRDWDYARFRDIANKLKPRVPYLLCDMAHYSGLVVAEEHRSPFEYCDIVTTTTHKTLRGPRAGLIFYRRDIPGMEEKINTAVFPGCQGGPHNNAIAGVAIALKMTMTDEFREYIRQVKRNAKVMAERLLQLDYDLVTAGTENHLVLWDLRRVGLTGSKLEWLADLCEITINKNSVPGDRSALSPGGVRLGTPALTTRGFKEAEIVRVVDWLDQLVKLGLKIQEKSGKKLVDFRKTAEEDREIKKEIDQVRAGVVEMAEKFPLPGL